MTEEGYLTEDDIMKEDIPDDEKAFVLAMLAAMPDVKVVRRNGELHFLGIKLKKPH